MVNGGIFHPDFKDRPYWWEAHEPKALEPIALPAEIDVVVVGAGYAGLNAALELHREGIGCIVLDAAEPGFGASTRSGGLVSGGVNVGKRYLAAPLPPDEADSFLGSAADAISHVEDLIARENIDCGWQRTGYFLGAWCRRHFDAMAAKVALLNDKAASEAYLVPPERQREEIGSDYYRGGMVVGRAGHLHPALYYKGLLDLCLARAIPIASNTPAGRLTRSETGWRVETPRGAIACRDVIVATNGYTGDVTPQFQRRVVPVGSYIVATEELPEGLAARLSPRNRAFADTRLVLTYYRLSPDGRRMIFGGRAKFGPSNPVETAPILYRFMVDRFPELAGIRLTHAWTGNVAFTIDEVPHMGRLDGLHYALGCNGSGVAMMSYLGHQTARKIAGKANRVCAFDRAEFPTHPLYTGNPWFVPWLGRYFRTRDWLDRRFG